MVTEKLFKCHFLYARCAFGTPAPAQIHAGVSPSVARLSIETKDGRTYVASAFLAYDDATAVTSWHAVHDAARVTAVFSSGKTFAV